MNIDWSRLVNDLCRACGSQKNLASRIGMSGATLGNLKTGLTKQPVYSNGKALLDLAKVKRVKVYGY